VTHGDVDASCGAPAGQGGVETGVDGLGGEGLFLLLAGGTPPLQLPLPPELLLLLLLLLLLCCGCRRSFFLGLRGWDAIRVFVRHLGERRRGIGGGHKGGKRGGERQRPRKKKKNAAKCALRVEKNDPTN
jgi:hypothetical protein